MPNQYLAIVQPAIPHAQVINVLLGLHPMEINLLPDDLDPFEQALDFVLNVLLLMDAPQAQQRILASKTDEGQLFMRVDRAGLFFIGDAFLWALKLITQLFTREVPFVSRSFLGV